METLWTGICLPNKKDSVRLHSISAGIGRYRNLPYKMNFVGWLSIAADECKNRISQVGDSPALLDEIIYGARISQGGFP